MAYTLTLSQSSPFPQSPRFAELEGEKILLNNVILPRAIDPESAFNPHNVRLWVIGHEFGPLCAVWASHEQEALDEACNAGMLESLQVAEGDMDDSEDYTDLGNASEPHDLTYAWCAPVEFDAARDIALIVAIVRRSEQTEDTL